MSGRRVRFPILPQSRLAQLSGFRSLAINRLMLKRHLPVGFVVPAQPVERDKPPAGVGGRMRSSTMAIG
jgi:hypothetical protein